MRSVNYFIVFFVFCATFWADQLLAQSYVQTRLGYGTGRYKPLDKDKLNRDEHDFLGGGIFDVELGRSFGSERFSLLLGGRLQYSLRVLEGIYSENTSSPDVNINVHVVSVFFTIGGRVRIINKFNALVQVNIGPSYILWYQDGKYANSFWKFYLPLDGGFEYELKDSLSLVSGVSVVPPIYLSTTVNYFIGIRKEF